MRKYEKLATEIIDSIGGAENITNSFHCITRLRFNVADEKKIDIERIKKFDGVFGAQFQQDQFQVIIGNEVDDVYEEVKKGLGDDVITDFAPTKPKKTVKGIINIIFDTISGIFTPILPAIVGAGLLKGVMALLVAFSLLAPESSEYVVLNIISDAPFYFLPFLVAFSAAKKFKTNEYLSVTIAGVMMYPTIINYATSGEVTSLSFFGLNIPMINYSSSVIPIILGVWLLSFVYRKVDKVIPKVVRIIFTPLISLLITAMIVLMFIAPMGNYLGGYADQFFSTLFTISGPFAGMLLGGVMPLIVITGMHYAFFPTAFTGLASVGYDMIFLPMNLVSNFAQAGATLAVAVKTKDKEFKSLAYSAFISAIFGITEPAMYGVTLKLKKPFYAAIIGGAIGGGIFATLSVKTFAFSIPGITAIPTYIEQGTNNLLFALLGIVASFGVAFVLTLVFKIEENN